MSLIKAVAELSINYNKKTLAEFQALPEYKELEENAVVVQRIEQYQLPEITLLICSSEKLRSLPWAQRYVDFSNYCLNLDKIDVRSELDSALNLEEFTNRFLAFKYEPVIKRFSQFFTETVNQNKALMDKKRTKNAVLKEAEEIEKKRIAANIGQNVIAAENEKLLKLKTELQDLKSVIDSYSKFIKKYKTYSERAEEYLSYCKEAVLKEIRNKMYTALSEIESQKMNICQQDNLQMQEFAVEAGKKFAAVEDQKIAIMEQQYYEAFLQKFIEEGTLDALLCDRLRADDAAQWLLKELNQAEYYSKALKILVQLHGLGEIDLEQEEYTEFLVQNSDCLEEYLCQQYCESNALQESALEYLFELAVKLEYSGAGGRFRRLWNKFDTRKLWLRLLSNLKNIEPDDFSRYIYKYMIGLSGKTAQLVAELLLNDKQFSEVGKPMDIITELLVNNPSDNKEIIYYYLLLQEEQKLKLAQRVKKLKQQVDRQGQELFTDIYQPVERLEELAVNVKLSSGEISNKLLAGKLMEELVRLRKNLIDLGVEPLVEPDDWQQQNLLTYDVKQHQFAVPKEKKPAKVWARTMGFSYYNSDKELQNREAFVYCEKPNPSSKIVEACVMDAGEEDTIHRITGKKNIGKAANNSNKQMQQKDIANKMVRRKGGQ